MVWALLLLLGVAVIAGGCGGGPVEYVHDVVRRSRTAVSAARTARAHRHAPYEYTAAQEYLHKAQEEVNHAHYQTAIEYGRRAEELALQARSLAVERSQSKAATDEWDETEPGDRPSTEDGPALDDGSSAGISLIAPPTKR